ncbi:MAG: hypothetical protein ACT60Q_00435 [Ferrovibrionaceae bacterium]
MTSRSTWLRLTGAVALAVAAAFQPAVASASSQQCTASAISAGGVYDCWLCSAFEYMAYLSAAYGQKVYTAMAIDAANVLGVLALVSGHVWALKIILLPGESRAALDELLKRAGWLIAAALLLSANGVVISYDYIFTAMQQAAGDVGTAIMAYASSIGGAPQLASVVGGGAPAGLALTSDQSAAGAAIAAAYTGIWAQVEHTLTPLVCFSMSQISEAGWSLSVIPRAIMYLLLLTPYIFVMGVFAALLLQSQFYFTAISAVTPVLVLFLVFDKTRGMFGQSLKVLLTGSFTIVFCAVAMGFTGMVIAVAIHELVGLAAAAGSSAAIEIGSASSFWDATGAPPAAVVLDNPREPYMSMAYLKTLMIGFISILLHLAAPRIAANIGGATDSAMSAAAVVGIGQLGASRGVMATKGALLGRDASQFGGLAGAVFGGAASVGRRGADMLGSLNPFSRRLKESEE